MNELFRYIRKYRQELIQTFGDPLSFCSLLATDIDRVNMPTTLTDLLRNAPADDHNYAVSSAYALLMEPTVRKALSAYFTPPTLVDAVLDAASDFIEATNQPAILDPACGGGSFLTPISRHLINAKCQQGMPVPDACTNALSCIRGIELDAGLAKLSAILLQRMLAREYKYSGSHPCTTVSCGDALSISLPQTFDLVIGNPPYGKTHNRIDKHILKASGKANLGGHTNIYSLFILRSLEWLKPGGGLVFVLPTSFVAGPYFAGLRQEILSRATVERIDLHEQRDNLFPDYPRI